MTGDRSNPINSFTVCTGCHKWLQAQPLQSNSEMTQFYPPLNLGDGVAFGIVTMCFLPKVGPHSPPVFRAFYYFNYASPYTPWDCHRTADQLTPQTTPTDRHIYMECLGSLRHATLDMHPQQWRCDRTREEKHIGPTAVWLAAKSFGQRGVRPCIPNDCLTKHHRNSS